MTGRGWGGCVTVGSMVFALARSASRVVVFALLLPAVSAAQDIYLPDDVDHVEVPLEFVDYGTMGAEAFVLVRIGAIEGRFCIDTGAALAIDEAFADRAGLGRGMDTQRFGVASQATTETRYIEEMRVGSIVFERFAAGAMDLSHFGDRHDGLLGWELLGVGVVDLDFAAGRLRVWEDGAFELPAGVPCATLPMVPSMGSVDCRVRIGPVERARCYLDTGNSAALTLHSPFVRKHGLLTDRDAFVRSEYVGVFGEFAAFRGQLDRFDLGSLRFTGIPVELTDLREGVLASGLHAANLGLSLFRGLRVVIDGRKRKMYVLDPAERTQIQWRDTCGVGVYPSEGKGVEVFEILDGSPAAGLVEVDDRILAVGDEVFDQADTGVRTTAVSAALRAMDAATLRVLRGGATVEVKLQRRDWLAPVKFAPR